MPELSIGLNGGRVTGRNPADLRPGELREALGLFYRPEDSGGIHVLPTRSIFGTIVANATFKGLVLCQFDDNSSDRIVAFIGTDLYLADANGSGTFTPAGLTLVGTSLSAAFADPRWYICTNGDPVYVLESNGTIYRAGMQAPDVQPQVTLSSAAISVSYPTALAGPSGWMDTGSAVDGDLATFSYRTTDTFATTPQYWGWSAGGAASRTLRVTWSIAGSAGMSAFAVIEYSIDSGANWIVLTNALQGAPTGVATLIASISAALTSIQIRSYVLETALGIPVTMKIHDIRALAGASVADFTTAVGLYYAFGEYDSSRGHYSSIGPVSALKTGTFALATMPLPTAAKNARSTHWVVYRTADGGATPQRLGILATIPIVNTSYVDDFSIYAFDQQPLPIVRLLQVGDLYFSLDDPPPLLAHVNFYRGALVGVTTTGTLAYSEDGFPESWPTENEIERGQMPFPEHDVPRGTMTVGEVLVVLCDGSVLTMNALPRVVNLQFNEAEITPLRGQSGVVGIQAFCTYSVSGEPRGAWASPYGVAITNGQTAQRISGDMDWSGAYGAAEKPTTSGQTLLRWLPDKQALELVVDRTTAYLLHLGEHQKGDDAKITKTTAPVAALAGGLIGGVFRLFSGHATDGKVYREQYSGAEAWTLRTGKGYGETREFQVQKANLRHSDFGASATCSVSWFQGRDSSALTRLPRQKTISLSGSRGTEFGIHRAGEYAEVTISGTAAGALLDLRAQIRTMGKAGRVTVA